MYSDLEYCAGTLSDEEVVARVLTGEAELFEIIVRRHGARLYRTTLFVLRDPAEAEDAVQDTYLNAYSRLRQFAGRARFSTWLLHIALNNARERARRRAREVPTDSEDSKFQSLANPGLDPEAHLRNRELSRRIAEGLASLPLKYRQILVLRDVCGVDTRVTAQRMRISETNVKVRLHRARRVLRSQLVPGTPGESPTLGPNLDGCGSFAAAS